MTDKQWIFDSATKHDNKWNWQNDRANIYSMVSRGIDKIMAGELDGFRVVIGKLKKDKSWYQLRAFYEAMNQLLPQYNARQEEQGKKHFMKDEFKFILKYVGGWYKTIENKKGESIPIAKSFDKISREDMIIVLDNIQRWAISEEYTLSIDESLRDLIK